MDKVVTLAKIKSCEQTTRGRQQTNLAKFCYNAFTHVTLAIFKNP